MLRREIPIILAMVVGWLMVGEYFIPKLEAFGTEVQQFAVIMTACAAVLGVGNVARINLLKVSRREEDWHYSVILLVGLLVMVLLGTFLPILRWAFGVDQEWMLGTLRLTGVTDGTLFDRIYNRMYVPLQATMFSLLAFYIASAAFRAFRVRTVEASLLAAAAMLVMIGRVPLGEKIWEGLPLLTDWVMNVPNLAAKRAILIGAALGAISTGLKIVLGIERNYLGSD
jgi:hypothetical protein